MGVCERIKNEVEITDYAAYLGFTLKKVGNYYTLKEHDSVIISPKRKKYWQNSIPSSGGAIGEGGSVIDFAMNFGGYSQDEAIRQLASYGNIKFNNSPGINTSVAGNEENRGKQLKLPQADADMKKAYAYLTKTRGISGKIVREMQERKMLYQDTKGNCVFVGYDINDKDKPVFACKRGTNTFKKFIGDVAGCDYSKGFYVDNDSEKIMVTESVIDAMSIMSLCKDHKTYNYLALGGTGKYEALKYYLDNHRIMQVIIALDNDDAGIRGAECICRMIYEKYPETERRWMLPKIKSCKDWNEVLMKK